jgi:hypothetical protein
MAFEAMIFFMESKIKRNRKREEKFFSALTDSGTNLA